MLHVIILNSFLFWKNERNDLILLFGEGCEDETQRENCPLFPLLPAAGSPWSRSIGGDAPGDDRIIPSCAAMNCDKY